MTDTHGNKPMDPKTLEALKASIAKWEANVEAGSPKDVKMGSNDCPLCDMFVSTSCARCPVSGRTGLRLCEGTPYYQASGDHWQWASGHGTREQFQAAAQAEVDFLKSLLPGETP